VVLLPKLAVLDKKTDRAVIGPLLVLGEKTGGQLVILAVIVKALAALSPLAARGVGTVAVGIVFFHLTFHR
jgi:hypothetical protein